MDDAEFAALEQKNRTLILLNRASQILTSTHELEEVLARLLQVTTQIINASGSSVWLWVEGDTDTLVCQAAFNPDTAVSLAGEHIQRGQGVAGWVAQAGHSAIVADPQTDRRFYAAIDARSGFTTESLIAVPLHYRGRVIGVLEVVNKANGAFTQEDLWLVETLAASAAIAIENARLVASMRQQMQDLQEQNEELAAFDHTVAHDLQNPLALVVGFADVLLQNGLELTQEEQHKSLELIVENAHRMSNIIDELLMLSSVRKHDVDLVPVHMAAVVDSALGRLRYMIQQYDPDIVLPESWPEALGYAPWLEEVWENFLSNAMKYGGDPPQIELGSTVEANGRIRFWIRDNGPGIPPEKQAMLFMPFTRLNQVRVTGFGLGLSIVQRIVHKLGGEVGVESHEGQGSTFSFTLLAPPAEA